MVRGTTAQFKFKLPYNVSDISVVCITFWQEHYNGPDATRPLPIIKVLSQCSFTNNSNELMVSLNKEETLRFTEDRKAYVQLRAKTVEGTAFATKKTMITVYPVYDDSILDDNIVPTPSLDGKHIILNGSSVL